MGKTVNPLSLGDRDRMFESFHPDLLLYITMKICRNCKQSKEESEFSRLATRKDGLAINCKECKSEYDKNFHSNRSSEVKKHKQELQRSRKADIVRTIGEYALSIWCIDCWYNENMAALQFDHLRDKKESVSNMAGHWYSIESIMKEIEKCEVRCANCHAIKTARDYSRYK